MFGSTQATTYVKNGQEYDVILQTDLAAAPHRWTTRTTSMCAASSGALVPLSNVVTTQVRGDTPEPPPGRPAALDHA